MILEVDDVYSGYGKLEVLHGVSIRAKNEKITCILGPNGSGKSTLLRTIFGFLKPRKGKVFYDGKDITGKPPYELLQRGISYILQERGIFPYMSVAENLEMGAYVRKDRAQVSKDLESVYDRFPILRERRKVKASKLSGGEQKMLELGRCLLVSPRVMLIDEPSLGLAPKLMDACYDKIKELNESGVTIILVEQNVLKALSVADYAYFLAMGKIQFEHSGEEIISSDKLHDIYLGGSLPEN